MYKDVLRSIDGIGLYPAISVVIFFLFFTTVFLWVSRIRRQEAEDMAALPLEDGEIRNPQPGEPRHGEA
jgi:hypothetical protein